MKRIFSKWLPCATLAAWSAILLYFYFSGHIKALLVPTFRPFTLIAGLLLLLLAVCMAFLPVNLESCAEDEIESQSFGKRTYGRILTFLILIVPMCAAAAFSSGSYGVSTMLNRGVVTDASGLSAAQQTKSTPYVEPPLPTSDGSVAASTPAPASQPPPPVTDEIPRSKDGNIIVQVVDLLYAARDTSLQSDFKGQKIEMIGQLMPDTENNGNGKRFKLVRMFMVCCAADARPVAVIVESGEKSPGAEMSWIKVVGHVEFPLENGKTIAVVKADKVTQTEPPEETMLY